MITVSINNEMKQIEAGRSLGDFLREQEYNVRVSAVGVNDVIIPKSSIESTPLADGDVIDVLHLVNGG
ncbi:MAG: sulfur carrier protein ThiS [Clostridiales Family XIII bacterium]|jgi:thiamine biosynthesis protein ThiS|nr:sulfur carrier protein ThiS [Clostridiales Family XIII bacterium]